MCADRTGSVVPSLGLLAPSVHTAQAVALPVGSSPTQCEPRSFDAPSWAADTQPVRVLVVDRHAAYARALSARLAEEPALVIVGIVHDGEAVLPAVRAGAPDVVVLDIGFGQSDSGALPLLEPLRQEGSEIRVLVLSDADDVVVARSAIQCGVGAWIRRSSHLDDIANAVHALVAGESRWPTVLLSDLLGELGPGGGPESHQALTNLSVRQQEVLGLLAQGLDRTAIARMLGLSPNTVRTHIQNMMKKLDAHSVLEAVVVGLRCGLGR